ncbi:DUF4169 family protein [Telmatospirillum sp.]|uniref:DUF4169 family protein n=1 Tax=Telmatospirillum sp. TaxID=2079197 RepID=UPI00283F2D62|nr:DUF4169 family protein [Telmatospirillum sp.]MDR3441232.1 DUF4169 family protein [Telmatospirillum sp.]
MAEVINLNRFRKAKARTESTRQAEENRVRFGRDKRQKRATELEKAQQAKDLDDKKHE